MPELPEVERGRRIAEIVAKGRTIRRARCMDDRIVYCDQAPSTVARRLRGRTVLEACRHGKQLWLEFDEGPALLLHFGMTGALHGDESPVDRPRFCRLDLEFEDGRRLFMTDPRRFGRIRLRDDPRKEPPVSLLGFDPLLEMPTPAVFRGLLERRKVTIKGLLLDQSFAAGVGNWIADEVLYQAGIAPARRSCDLEKSEIERVRSRLASVIRHSVAVEAVSRRFPTDWLFHHRWGRTADARTAREEEIVFDTVAGRTTAWVPAVQS